MENKKKYIKGLLGFVLVISIFFLFEWFLKQDIQKNAHFTIAEIQKFSYGADGTKFANFNYFVGKKEFHGTFAIPDTRIKGVTTIGSRYVLVYSLTKPDDAYLDFDYKVPDTLKYIPLNGWAKLPSYVKKQ